MRTIELNPWRKMTETSMTPCGYHVMLSNYLYIYTKHKLHFCPSFSSLISYIVIESAEKDVEPQNILFIKMSATITIKFKAFFVLLDRYMGFNKLSQNVDHFKIE